MKTKKTKKNSNRQNTHAINKYTFKRNKNNLFE